MQHHNVNRLINQLLKKHRLPLRQCLGCGEPVERIRALVVRSGGVEAMLPISCCRKCASAGLFEDSNAIHKRREHISTVSILINAVAATGSVMTGSLIPMIIGLIVAACLLLFYEIKRREKRREAQQHLYAVPLLRELFGNRTLTSLYFAGGWHSYDAEQAVPLDAVVMLTPTDDRVNPRELQSYLVTLCRFVDAMVHREAAGRNLECQLALAIFPSQRVLIEFQQRPAGALPAALEQQLRARIEELPCPAVREPIAFMRRVLVGGGALPGKDFKFPLKSFLKPTGGESLEQLLSRVEPATGKDSDSVHGWSPLEYTRLLKADPGNISALLARAELFMENEDIQAALQDFSQAIELRPADPDLLARRADCLGLDGQTEAALDAYDRALQSDPQHIHALNNRAMLHLNEGRIEEALHDLSQALQVDPDEARLYVGMALAYRKLGQSRQAIEQLDLALAHDPDCARAYFERARVLVDESRFTQAVEDIDRAIQLQPRDIDYRLYRSQLLAHQGKHELAIDELTDCIHIAPDSAVCWGLRGVSHQELDQQQEAVEDCSRAIELGLRLPRVYLSRAVAHRALHDEEHALADLDNVLELDPNNAAALNVRGLIYASREDFDEAIEQFTLAIKCDPDWAIPYFHRGNAHAELGEMRHAIHDYQMATERMPELAVAHTNRGIARSELGEIDQALEDFEAAIESDSTFVPGYFERASRLIQNHDYRAALDDLNEVIRNSPEFTPAYYARANALHSLDELELAVEDLNTVIEQYPTFAAAYCSRGRLRFELGERDLAREDFAEAARIEPESAEEFIEQRLICEIRASMTEHQFEEAVDYADEALDLNPEAEEARFLRAYALWLSGGLVEACDGFTELIDEADDETLYRACRGQVYVELGEYELALSDLDAVIEAVTADPEENLQCVFSARAVALEMLGRQREVDPMLELAVVTNADVAAAHYNHGLVYLHRQQPAHAAHCFRVALSLNDVELAPSRTRKAQSYLELHPELPGSEGQSAADDLANRSETGS